MARRGEKAKDPHQKVIDEITKAESLDVLPARVLVSTTIEDNRTGKTKAVVTDTCETIEVPTFHGLPVSRVSATLGVTLNTGNYESVKTSVTVTRPCYPGEEAKCFEFCDSFVTERVQAEKEAVRRMQIQAHADRQAED